MSGKAGSGNDRMWRYRAPPVFTELQRSRWQALLEQRTGISYALHTSILQAGIYRRMVDLGYEDGQLPFEHFRSDDMLFTFRTRVPVGPDEESFLTLARQLLLGYEACFRQLGDMGSTRED